MDMVLLPSGSITGCRDAIDEYKRELSCKLKVDRQVDRRSIARIIVFLISRDARTARVLGTTLLTTTF